ncbi:hypothetical protein KC368_g41 [Hortaea werneckii]|nr:hypothetical protein KC368_g41 [Hortaea werneckii]
MKLSGKYMKYLMIALGVNLAKGLPIRLPSLAIAVPSNVSIRLSSIKRAFESTVVNVLLSLRTSRAVLKAARGPEVKKRTAS